LDKETKELGAVARTLALGGTHHEVLRSRHDCIIFRVAPPDSASFIVKLWKRPGVRGFLRRITQTGNLDREWKTLNHLSRFALAVPEAITRFHFDSPINGYTDAIVMQDIGVGVLGTEYLTQLLGQELKQGSADERIKFENSVIELTASILQAGVLDLDHHLVNMIVTPSGDIVRLDFEISTIVRNPRRHTRKFAWVIANLMTSYIVAVNAHGKETANGFAMKLAKDLELPANLLRHAKVKVEKNLESQQQQSGLDLRWTPPW